MPVINSILGGLLVLLTPFAGPYRVIMFKFRTFGGIGTGLMTWAGIFFAYPALVLQHPPDGPEGARVFLWSWLALVVWAYVQTFSKWCSNAPRRDPTMSHSWFGRWEPAFALAFSFAASKACSSGSGLFILAGYECSIGQIALIRLRRRSAAWTSEDTRRLVSPLRIARQRLTPVAVRGVGQASSAIRFGALSLIPIGAALFAGAKHLFAKSVSPAATPAGPYRPPTFWARVSSYLVGHMVFSILTGAIGFWGLLKGIGMILAIPAAIILWLLGGKPDLPSFAKEDGKAVVQHAREIFDDKKDEAIERLHSARPSWEEKLKEERSEISDEFARRKRQALWDYFTK